uniref:Putative DC1 domain-containing family protein n=1 Tax=Davidia involucrata TaxID=16924 RepID=A0A5B6ZD20_DAVIN
MKKNRNQGQVQEKVKLKYRFEVEVEVERKLIHREKEIKHFSHRHPLQPCKVPAEANTVCAVCESDLWGSVYGCTSCDFFLHKSCFKLPREIQHKSHPDHRLTLLSSSPYQSGVFGCDGCGDDGWAFHYHCSLCQYDLHVGCAALPKTLYFQNHRYPLHLYYSFPHRNEAAPIYCDVCDKIVDKKGWVYYNRNSDYVSHLDCATDVKSGKELQDSVLAIQEQLQALQTK